MPSQTQNHSSRAVLSWQGGISSDPHFHVQHQRRRELGQSLCQPGQRTHVLDVEKSHWWDLGASERYLVEPGGTWPSNRGRWEELEILGFCARHLVLDLGQRLLNIEHVANDSSCCFHYLVVSWESEDVDLVGSGVVRSTSGLCCGHWERRWRQSSRVNGGSPIQDGDDKSLTCLRWEKKESMATVRSCPHLYSRQGFYIDARKSGRMRNSFRSKMDRNWFGKLASVTQAGLLFGGTNPVGRGGVLFPHTSALPHQN